MAAPRIVLRADGDSRIGTGHVMRTLALAAGARAVGAEVVLASSSLAPGLAARARRDGVEVITDLVPAGSASDADWVTALARRACASWIVVDGYAFGAAYRRALRTAGAPLLVIDDFGRDGAYAADLLVNPNVFAGPDLYGDRDADTRLLLGPRFALLRPEFAVPPPTPRPQPRRASRLLVTLGGADPAGLTRHVVSALTRLPDPDLRVTVLIGAAATFGRGAVGGDPRVHVLDAVDDMAALMATTELAITGAGTTVYELCALGVPTVVVPLVEAQRPVAAALSRQGLVRTVADLDPAIDPDGFAAAVAAVIDDAPARRALSAQGRAAVDGRGVERVLAAMEFPAPSQP